jgi:hypothetical protein
MRTVMGPAHLVALALLAEARPHATHTHLTGVRGFNYQSAPTTGTPNTGCSTAAETNGPRFRQAIPLSAPRVPPYAAWAKDGGVRKNLLHLVAPPINAGWVMPVRNTRAGCPYGTPGHCQPPPVTPPLKEPAGILGRVNE